MSSDSSHVTQVKLQVCSAKVGLSTLVPQSVDLIVTRLAPVELGYGLELLQAVAGALKNDGSVFLFVGADRRNPLLPHELLVKLQPILRLRNEFHWFKCDESSNPEMLDDDKHEYVFQLTRYEPPRDQEFPIAGRWVGKTTWFCECKSENIPREIAAKCIRTHGWQTNLVMVDTSVSDGNTAIAAFEMGIGEFIGFCLNPKFMEHAQEYISKRREELAHLRRKLDRPNT